MAVALCLLVLLPATAAAAYYALLTALGRPPHRPPHRTTPVHHLTVLVPAHDEQAGLPRTLHSVATAYYPPALLRVLVVADNCTDDTAAVAAAQGADVVIRTDRDRRGKGFAVAFGLTRLTESTDAVFVLDADCEISPGLLARLDAELTAGAEVVQARLLSRAGDGPTGYLAAVGAEVDHAVAVGQSRLGWGVPLRGTGMLFARQVLRRLPWTANGPTEDAEYAATLDRDGVQVKLVAEECVYCDAPATASTLFTQRQRWRAALRVPGKLFSRLVASKPLIILQLVAAGLVVAGCLPFLSQAARWVFGVWLTSVSAATVWVYVRAGRRVGRAGQWWWMWVLPALVARLGWIALEGLWTRELTWVRSARTPASSSPAPTG